MSDAINDAGADQQVGSYIDFVDAAVEGDRIWSGLQTPDGCVGYCAERTIPFLQDRSDRGHKLFFRAGQMMGCDGGRAREMVAAVKRRGSFSAVQAWLDRPPALPRWVIAGPTLDQIGFVYTARVRSLPHILKIGFSRVPDRRMKELEWKFGEPMELLAVKVGTVLDEAHAHCLAGRRYIGREFVFAPDFNDVRPGRIPDFLLGPFAHVAEG